MTTTTDRTMIKYTSTALISTARGDWLAIPVSVEGDLGMHGATTYRTFGLDALDDLDDVVSAHSEDYEHGARIVTRRQIAGWDVGLLEAEEPRP